MDWTATTRKQSSLAKKKDKKEKKIQNSKPTISMDAREFVEAVASFLIAAVVIYMEK